ncbi:tripartite tricarboxylate transporter TctB family protein [Hansschlegelia sp.]|uniref:tripartite tricarboxylate transporter TctB family protein n=1 Tax=Hansschlegelia sp. TaxID=2041892 RepID=UPI002D17107D|nr:tripartite tricarboxylate transporter TctB family protein [Hansschlegelia sp.]HVI27399.1 tripartite tricarboxylate transporter TctB family protein [Hansschlegelia sp.]
MSHAPEVQDERALVSTRAADIVVALLFLVASAIVIADSTRLGFDWRPNEGPAPGYFPFYIAVIMAFASAVNLARAVLVAPEGEQTLTTRPGFMRMMAIFVPAVVYAFATSWIGIYVSSAIYIAAFMIFFGRFAVWKAAAVSLSIALIAFLMFEIWFLVPLPKGPLEAALGY